MTQGEKQTERESERGSVTEGEVERWHAGETKTAWQAPRMGKGKRRRADKAKGSDSPLSCTLCHHLPGQNQRRGGIPPGCPKRGAAEDSVPLGFISGAFVSLERTNLSLIL